MFDQKYMKNYGSLYNEDRESSERERNVNDEISIYRWYWKLSVLSFDRIVLALYTRIELNIWHGPKIIFMYVGVKLTLLLVHGQLDEQSISCFR